MRISLVYRVLLLAIISACLAGWAAGQRSYKQAIKELLEHEKVGLVDETKLAAHRLKAHFHQLRQDVLALRSDSAIQRLAQQHDHLTSLMEKYQSAEGDEKAAIKKDIQQLRNPVDQIFRRIYRVGSSDGNSDSARSGGRGLKPYLRIQLIDRKQQEVVAVHSHTDERKLPQLNPPTFKVPRSIAASEFSGFDGIEQLFDNSRASDQDLGSAPATPILLSGVLHHSDSDSAVLFAAAPIVATTSDRVEFLGCVVVTLNFERIAQRLTGSPRHLVYLIEHGKTSKDTPLLISHPDHGHVIDTIKESREDRNAEARLKRDLPAAAESEWLEQVFTSDDPVVLSHGLPKRRLEETGVLLNGGESIELEESQQFWLTKLRVQPERWSRSREYPGELANPVAAGEFINAVYGPMSELKPSVRCIPPDTVQETTASFGSRNRAELLEDVRQIIAETPDNVIEPQYHSMIGRSVEAQKCKNFIIQYQRIYFHPLHSNHHIGLLMGFSREELQADLWPTTRSAYWGVALVIISVAFVGLVLTIQFVGRPLRQLIQAADAIGEGKVNVSLPTGTKDEIGLLASTLETMNTKLIQKSADLKRNEARFRAIFDTAADGVMTVDGEFLMRTVNPAAKDMFLLHGQEVREQPFLELVREEDRPMVAARFKEIDLETTASAMIGSTSYVFGDTSRPFYNSKSVEVVAVRTDGTPFSARISIGKVARDHAQRFALVITDITQQEEYRQQLEKQVVERTEKLSHALDDALAAERASDTFISNVNHELRNPLHKIISTCMRLEKQQKYGPLTEDQSRFVSDIRRHVRKQEELISEVLDLKRIKAGSLPLEVESFELAPFLEVVLNGIREDVNAEQVEISLRGNVENVVISTDLRKLEAIYTNLLTNACKFTRQGTITVEMMNDADDTEYLTMHVSDTGVGMTEEQQSRLFVPFQTHRDRELNPEGIGLGLVYSKSLARQLKGDVTLVRSEVGVGTTFAVKIRRVLEVAS